MTEFYYLETKPDGEVMQWQRVAWELEGPPAMPEPMAGNVMHALSGPVQWPARPWRTSRLMFAQGGVTWTTPDVLDDLKPAVIAKCYSDVDAVYEAAVGKRATVYKRAEEAARAYLEAEVKPSPVSSLITGFAWHNPTGLIQSEVWAAQQIIERADAFLWAEDQMRNVMFARQADMRAATTHAQLSAAIEAWDSFIVWLRATLGL